MDINDREDDGVAVIIIEDKEKHLIIEMEIAEVRIDDEYSVRKEEKEEM